MDKNAIKKYAIWAREELIKRVSTKAEEYEIRVNAELVDNIETIGDRVLTATEKKQRTALIRIVKDKGFEQAMEEAAYTWFNRFIALRFMEVNGYLPSKVRIFTDDENNFKPQILNEAIRMELDGLDLEKVIDLKEKNKTDELYKYLIITQCNALHGVLPKMFPKIDDYTQLLFPDNILREGSAIEQMIAIIPEEDFRDAVQILGWLYQYYNSVPKDTVFANLKKNIKISKENIPAATQLFTPDWIVRYMVENSLGRIAVDKFGVDPVSMGWKYYLPEAEQTEEVQNQLKIINSEKITLEELRVIDPCMGSGHILVYAFDVLLQIYESQGYTSRDAVVGILENNLFGLDIDERAYQLAYFALMMKARSADRRFLSRKIEPQVYCPKGYPDGEEHGSLLNVDELEEKPQQTIGQLSLDTVDYDIQLNTWNFRRLLNQKYDVVVTNPPYVAPIESQKKYLAKNFPFSKNDLAMVFIERNLNFTKIGGYSSLINFPTWMFLASYEKLRNYMLENYTITNMVYCGRGIFGSDFGTTCFVLKNDFLPQYNGTYLKLFDLIGEVDSVNERERQFLERKGYFNVEQSQFKLIKGNPIAFWISASFLKTFSMNSIGEISSSQAGIVTGNDDLFLKIWFEVNTNNITFDAMDFCDKSLYRWVPINKGGAYRKYYGNYEYVVEIYDLWNCPQKTNISVRRSDPDYYFKKSIVWSATTMGSSSFRISVNKTSSTAAPSLYFDENDNLYFTLALLNSCLAQKYFDLLNPTVGLKLANVETVPFIMEHQKLDTIKILCRKNISLSKSDWDSFETSWDFEKHPLIERGAKWTYTRVNDNVEHKLIELAFINWEDHCQTQFEQLKANEGELNRIFIDIYGLQGELTPEVEDKNVTVRLAEKTRDIKSFISYAVGCMFGRYSLDVDGLAYAGGEFDSSKYTTFIPDADNVIPICDDEYFEDDIMGRFVDFVKVVYGAETLEQNLDFIAGALGGKGTSRDVIRNYFLNGFYADHCKVYSKRPIYWQLESGKKNGFKALIYMHRYEPDTMARVRTDYVHEQQGRYRTAIADLERRIVDASTSERVKLTKQLTKLKDQDTEIRIFEEKVHHLADQMIKIDLDDGVKKNYEIFKDVLSKIK